MDENTTPQNEMAGPSGQEDATTAPPTIESAGSDETQLMQ